MRAVRRVYLTGFKDESAAHRYGTEPKTARQAPLSSSTNTRSLRSIRIRIEPQIAYDRNSPGNRQRSAIAFCNRFTPRADVNRASGHVRHMPMWRGQWWPIDHNLTRLMEGAEPIYGEVRNSPAHLALTPCRSA